MKIKIRPDNTWIKYLLGYLCLFILYTPAYIKRMTLFDITSYIRIVILLISVLMFLWRNKWRCPGIVLLTVFLHFAFVFSSILNSSNISYSLFFLLSNVGSMCLCSYILMLKDNEIYLKIIVSYFMVLLFINAIVSIYNPDGLYEVSKVFVIKNQSTVFLGDDNSSISLYFVSLFWTTALTIRNEKYKRILFWDIVLFGSFVFLREIGTGIIVFLAMALLYFVMSITKFTWFRSGKKIVALNFGIFILIIVVRIQKYLESVIRFLTGKNASLGRNRVWDYSLQLIRNKFFVGYGISSPISYDDYSTVLAMERALARTGNTHNVFLQQVFWGGIFALGLFICILLIAMREFDRKKTMRRSNILLVILSGFLLRGMVEIGFEYYFVILPLFYYIDKVEECRAERKLSVSTVCFKPARAAMGYESEAN